jgi:hypothetical protein
MIIGATLSLLLHVLPPFRPLASRLRSADAIALIEIKAAAGGGLRFRSLYEFRGPKLSKASLMPGHAPPARSGLGLATFRQTGANWLLQEQGREWLELSKADWMAHPPPVWKRWLVSLEKSPETALLSGLRRHPFMRFAGRDLNALMLQPTRSTLRHRVAEQLRLGKLPITLSTSLKRHLLSAVSAAERKELQRCMASRTGCLVP